MAVTMKASVVVQACGLAPASAAAPPPAAAPCRPLGVAMHGGSAQFCPSSAAQKPIKSADQRLSLGALAAAAASLPAFASHAVDLAAGPIADMGVSAAVPGPVLGVGAAAALAAIIVAADPQKRRDAQAASTGGDEMAAVRDYFNKTGFERWRKIYGETDEVNKVQLDIRVGHAQTVDKVLGWLRDSGAIEGKTFCDAGCGTGSLAIPLALEGGKVYASDISEAMAGEAAQRAEAALAEAKADGGSKAVAPVFEAKDLESVTGKYDTVCCLDVLIHYPQDKADGMVAHLASLANERVILSFAPKTPYYSVLKRIGELFPGPSKATRAYLHAEADVEAAFRRAGWTVRRREMTATKFYFSRLLEATRD